MDLGQNWAVNFVHARLPGAFGRLAGALAGPVVVRIRDANNARLVVDQVDSGVCRIRVFVPVFDRVWRRNRRVVERNV